MFREVKNLLQSHRAFAPLLFQHSTLIGCFADIPHPEGASVSPEEVPNLVTWAAIIQLLLKHLRGS